MKLPLAILAGGLAQRLRPITQDIPKALVDVAGAPFIVHQLELLRRHNFSEVILCVGHLGEMIETTLGDGSRFGLRLKYVFDGNTLLGTGGALRKALPWLGSGFFVMYGDSYLDCNFAEVQQYFIESGKLGLMTVFHNQNRFDKSNVLFEGGKLLRYDRSNPTGAMQHIDYGLSVFHSQAFADYEENVKFDLNEVYQDLIARDQLAGLAIQQRFYEIGSVEGLQETRDYLVQRQIP